MRRVPIAFRKVRMTSFDNAIVCGVRASDIPKDAQENSAQHSAKIGIFRPSLKTFRTT